MPALPYTDAIVQLDEGVRVPTNIVECAPEDVRADMPVVAGFDGDAVEWTLPPLGRPPHYGRNVANC